MSTTATAIILGLLVLVAVKAHSVRPIGPLVCVVFGLVLGATAAGPVVNGALADLGASMWQTLQRM